MEMLSLIESHGLNKKALESKSPQTAKKIQYVKQYVLRWLKINASCERIKYINFIDCMCNAGIYLDGDLATAAEVIVLFIGEAARNPGKQYSLFINDNDSKKLEACLKVLNALLEPNKPLNIRIVSSNKDVNEYLSDLNYFSRQLSADASTILFVDPYNFGTVKISILASFALRYYCEIIFNAFTSDFVRNGMNDKIRECIGDADVRDKNGLIEFIIRKLKVGKMKYTYSYQFCNMNNTEIYQILFFTPCLKGLEKLKEALWAVFDGSEFYCNPRNPEALTLFDIHTAVKETTASLYAPEARDLLVEQFHGQDVTYKQISCFIIQRTMLKDSDCIRYVIKPLIDERRMNKKGLTERKNDYTHDTYTIR